MTDICFKIFSCHITKKYLSCSPKKVWPKYFLAKKSWPKNTSTVSFVAEKCFGWEQF